ncbi:hypothetical protein Mapa_008756 [Marchantia paleacea]|nr:hypothetical protein Mapa_008756 [Marchantia paleacea]
MQLAIRAQESAVAVLHICWWIGHIIIICLSKLIQFRSRFRIERMSEYEPCPGQRVEAFPPIVMITTIPLSLSLSLSMLCIQKTDRQTDRQREGRKNGWMEGLWKEERGDREREKYAYLRVGLRAHLLLQQSQLPHNIVNFGFKVTSVTSGHLI